ncbi:hypothetical protein BDV28DRAFT_99302 [Aspergillus coremiiformis]|uniref:Zn(2)-C6 fungal-type domain-containing protein n=1 Tax=Aspergillus coremiiformis TaxID=138285 RepID=A0A5N6Z9K0_9EURO|nr:hypothetical protein BDV28DRAFT_99302 [Aspergillus coremiiformis]
MKRRQSSSLPHDSPVESRPRKRVCKACDRCRSKKSKCDGERSCSRCQLDNTACHYGEKKTAREKIYPKGYVEMLEEQQGWLVCGVQTLYQRLMHGAGWPGRPLRCEQNGHPLTHDLLSHLGAINRPEHEAEGEFTTRQSEDITSQNPSETRPDSAPFSPTLPYTLDGASSLAPSTRHTPSLKTSQTTDTSSGFLSTRGSQDDIEDLPWPTSPQWSENVSPFDDMNFISGFEYMTTPFDDPIVSLLPDPPHPPVA